MTGAWIVACVVPGLFLSHDFANGVPVSRALNPQGQPARQATDDLLYEDQLVREIIARSFPNLIGIDIRVKRFQSDTDYFRTSFSAVHFLDGVKMRYFILVNPQWRTRGAPVEGVQAILAHELAHVEDLTRGNGSTTTCLRTSSQKSGATIFLRKKSMQSLPPRRNGPTYSITGSITSR